MLYEVITIRRTEQFIDALPRIGPITAALSFQELAKSKCRPLCVKLAALCKKETKLDLPQSYPHRNSYELEDGLRKSAAVALSFVITSYSIHYTKLYEMLKN